jgi:hypothetical protein
MKGQLLLCLAGAVIYLTSCSKGKVVIPAHPIQPDFKPLSPASVVFQLGNELLSLSENVYYSGNMEISATNPLHDTIFIDLASGLRSGDTILSQGGTAVYSERGNPSEFDEVSATVIFSGDSISGSFSGVGYSSSGIVPYATISGTFSNVPPKK